MNKWRRFISVDSIEIVGDISLVLMNIQITLDKMVIENVKEDIKGGIVNENIKFV